MVLCDFGLPKSPGGRVSPGSSIRSARTVDPGRSRTIQLTLPSGPDAARFARQAIAESQPSLPPTVLDDVWLLVTELVTNAARHGAAGRDGAVELDFRRDNGLVHVRVVDPGTEFGLVDPPTNGDSSGGWGLFLVDRIAERWGVSPAPSGTCVWFEVASGATH